MANGYIVDPDLDLIREVKKAGGDNLKQCYQCATCSVVCNLSPDNKPFPRKEMLMAQWGQTDKLMADPDLWLCYQCNDCSTYCPRDARPGDVLAAARSYIYQKNAFPLFMGKALANPKALPFLLLVPALIMIASIFLFSRENGEFLFVTAETIDFDYFLRHSFVDALFVLGNIFIFSFAAIGFVRFYKRLKNNEYEQKNSFISSAFKVASDIIMHKHFSECGANKQRLVGHALLFFGFLGAMITTGAVLVLVFLPHYMQLLKIDLVHPFFQVPLLFSNPVKILGIVSGMAICVGSLLMLFRRLGNKDEVGANGYTDYLFLYMMVLTGLTGMFSWIFRIGDMAFAAYTTYFVHILTAFFILWYMPYSKFAHMFYRTLALIYARTIGREARV